MKILTDKNSIALNQVAVQSMFGGVLVTLAFISFIKSMISFTEWLDGTGDPLVDILITVLLGVLAVGRMKSGDRYAETLSQFIREKS
jgi:hypothetical protein